jgi:hypothetical protein
LSGISDCRPPSSRPSVFTKIGGRDKRRFGVAAVLVFSFPLIVTIIIISKTFSYLSYKFNFLDPLLSLFYVDGAGSRASSKAGE